MAVDVAKAVYIVVVDDGGNEGEKRTEEEVTYKHSFRYTRPVLQSTLQLMGCKPRHAFKMSRRVFKMIPIEFFEENLVTSGVSELSDSKVYPVEEADVSVDRMNGVILADGWNDNSANRHFKLYKKRTTGVVKRKTFLDVVCMALTEYKYVGPNQRDDLALACRLRERKESVTVLLCGTSGCGKSTLSALLASRLGITTVISTDSIRHMMRSFVDEKQNPLLWASTYHAGEYLDPVAVSEAKAKRKAKKSTEFFNPRTISDGAAENSTIKKLSLEVSAPELIGPKQMAVEGFKAQGEMVIESLDRLITTWEERKESVVVEGVHLSLNFVMGLMKKHPSIIPFMIYIANEEKHMERFAVRAKYMTLDPAKNKYVKYIRNIRTIQEYLCKRADKHLVPKINNTNVDRSVAAIHATVFSCLRRREAGEQLYDPMTNTVAMVDEEYKSQRGANSLSSKGMLQLIQRQGSSNHLMALLNHDGSVAKVWPVNTIEVSGEGDSSGNGIGTPMYGPLQISKAEPVNLQFGNFGISAWPSDIGCTSRASSVDESRGDSTNSGSVHYSPRLPDGHAKKMKEEEFVYGSDEELDESPETGSDEDHSDDERHITEEMEGSVDESNNTDEEYDDLAIQETGYLSDEDEEFCINGVMSTNIIMKNKYTLKQPFEEDKEDIQEGKKHLRNSDLFLETDNECKVQPPALSTFTI